MRRHQRRTPLRPDLRVDALVAQLRGAEPARASGHRGQRALTLSDAELRTVVDGLVLAGSMLRTGHRVRLPDDDIPALDPVMRERVEVLVATLTAAGARPPSAEALATRLGVPAQLLDQLRASGELVSIGPRIDLTRESWAALATRLEQLAAAGPLSVAIVRDDLDTARRFAERILHHWNRLRSHQ